MIANNVKTLHEIATECETVYNFTISRVNALTTNNINIKIKLFACRHCEIMNIISGCKNHESAEITIQSI